MLVDQRDGFAREQPRRIAASRPDAAGDVGGGLRERERRDLAPQRHALFQLAQAAVFRRAASSGWPASTSGSSFSVAVSMLASSRISSSSSRAQALSLVDDERGDFATRRRSRSIALELRQQNRLGARCRGCSLEARGEPALRRTRRVSAPGCSGRRSGHDGSASESRAARSSVVLPVPASPISTVRALAVDRPYCRLLSASRCRGVRNRYFGLGVSSNGSSRRP